jgi:transcriptional regulator with XRE-family HTH domain
MNRRLKALRNAKGLSQTEFGSKVGLSASTISAIEAGKTPMNETNIKVFCSEYGVSEHWLRTGEGEMFESRFKTPFEKEIEGLDVLTPDEGELIGIYRKLTLPNKEKVMEYADEKLELQGFREDKNEKGEKEEESTGDITSKTG